MKNIQWVLIIGVVTIVLLLIGVMVYSNLSVHDEGAAMGGAYVIIFLTLLLFFLAPIGVGIVAKERKGLHTLLTLVFLLIVGTILFVLFLQFKGVTL